MISSGTPAPIPNAAVSSSAPKPTLWLAPTTAIVASTGPAHGTYSNPSPRPSTKPLLFGLTWRAGSRANGRASSSPNFSKIRLSPMSTSTAMPRSRSRFCGRCRADRMSEPNSVAMQKLTTRPATTPYGRHDHVLVGCSSVSADGAGAPAVAISGAGTRRLAPAVRITGRTGSTHGEMLVIMPARNPTTTNVIMRAPGSTTGPDTERAYRKE